MGYEKTYELLKSTNDLATNASPYTNLLAGKCNNLTAVNNIKGYNYLYRVNDNVFIVYNTDYVCNDIPITNIQQDNIKTVNISNTQSVNVSNPIIYVDNDIVKYFDIPNEVTEDYTSTAKKVYTIKKREYDGSVNTFIDEWTKRNIGPFLNVYKYTNSNNKYFTNTPDTYNTPSQLNINNTMSTTTLLKHTTSRDTYHNMLSCNEGDYISGWSYTKSNNGGSTAYNINAKCVHYDVSSNVVSTVRPSCPADGDWPVTDSGRTASRSCSSGVGTITRLCSDGEWQQPVSHCSADSKPEQSTTRIDKLNDSKPEQPTSSLIDKLNNIGYITINGKNIYIWYILAAMIVFVLLLLIVKVKKNKRQEMTRSLYNYIRQ